MSSHQCTQCPIATKSQEKIQLPRKNGNWNTTNPYNAANTKRYCKRKRSEEDDDIDKFERINNHGKYLEHKSKVKAYGTSTSVAAFLDQHANAY
jgi:hypothetical protein